MKSENKDWFVYSSYWQKWSRVLLRRGGKYPEQVEVDLQALNDWDFMWKEVAQVNIRKHVTSPDKRDIYTHELPEYVLKNMRDNLDEATIRKLIHEDLLPQIDWEKYSKICNGGAALENILK